VILAHEAIACPGLFRRRGHTVFALRAFEVS
jgi:hypothetical protein